MKNHSLEPLQQFWNLSQEEILSQTHSNAKEGLSEAEAKHRLELYGSNSLKATKGRSTLKLLLSQFNTPLIYMLLFAATLSLILHDRTDALIVFAIIAISALLTFSQEKSAMQSMEKLLEIVKIKADVIRNRAKKSIPIEDVVPGDIVTLNAGDVIPGDCYLLEAQSLNVDESTLTGEFFFAEKSPGVLPENTSLTQRTNSLFMGTHVVSGTATALVVTTGRKTEFGKISEKLAFQPPETDFEHGIRHFGYILLEMTFILVVIIFAFNVYFERSVVESLLFALALAVGLTPQLLPAIISINLAHGASQMAKKSVIVKRLASIENFGSMNILCADKTGTLTTGKIKLDRICGSDGNENDKANLYAYVNSAFQSGYTNPIDDEIMKKEKRDLSSWKKLYELPYDFQRKRISILANNNGKNLLITKGAYAEVLDSCAYAENRQGEIVEIKELSDDINTLQTGFCKSGFRILAIAYKDLKDKTTANPKDEQQMIFLGFLLLFDPPKKDIVETISHLNDLGITLKIITGDNPLVALRVAQGLGLSEEHILTGQQLNKMNEHSLIHLAPKIAIFAEIEPNQKERIILALRKAGNVVGYLGDGINDVTALHSADISISVDTAADAAKEVADIVLLKKDLSALSEGVKAGRTTFMNTLKYIFMATSANFGNMFSMAGASLFLNFLPLLPKQVLLTNLMTDFPEMTIATDNVDQELVQKPLRWNVNFIRKFMFVFGLISSLFDYGTFGVLLWMQAAEDQFRTGWFVESVISATLIVLIIRTFRPFFTSKPSKYLLSTVILVVVATVILPFTPLAPYLNFTTLSIQLYLLIALLVFLYILTVEFTKKIFLKRWMEQAFQSDIRARNRKI